MILNLSLIHIILLASSPIFGLEALSLGDGKRFLSSSDGKGKSILYIGLLGFSIVGTSIGLSLSLNLQPLFSCTIVLGLTFVFGKIINTENRKSPKKDKIISKSEKSDEYIENMLKKRGLEKMTENKDSEE